MQNEMLCVSGCPKPSSKTLTLTITNKSHQIIPSFIFYIIISYIGSSHHSIQTTFFNPFLTHFWEVEQVPTTQSLTITSFYIGSSHHSIQTTFFNPFLTHFWEVEQVPTTQSLTITSFYQRSSHH